VRVTRLHGKFQVGATCSETVGDDMAYQNEEDEGEDDHGASLALEGGN